MYVSAQVVSVVIIRRICCLSAESWSSRRSAVAIRWRHLLIPVHGRNAVAQPMLLLEGGQTPRTDPALWPPLQSSCTCRVLHKAFCKALKL